MLTPHRLVLALVTFAVLSSAAPGVKKHTLDFDELPPFLGPLPANLYQAQGVLLSSQGVFAGVFLSEGEFTNSPPLYIIGSNLGPGTQGNRPVIVDFVLPGTTTPGVTKSVSFYVTDRPADTSGTYSASVLDVNGNVLATQTGTASNVELTFKVPGIHSLIFTPSTDGEGIDTLSFKPVKAPSPHG